MSLEDDKISKLAAHLINETVKSLNRSKLVKKKDKDDKHFTDNQKSDLLAGNKVESNA